MLYIIYYMVYVIYVKHHIIAHVIYYTYIHVCVSWVSHNSHCFFSTLSSTGVCNCKRHFPAARSSTRTLQVSHGSKLICSKSLTVLHV